MSTNSLKVVNQLPYLPHHLRQPYGGNSHDNSSCPLSLPIYIAGINPSCRAYRVYTQKFQLLGIVPLIDVGHFVEVKEPFLV